MSLRIYQIYIAKPNIQKKIPLPFVKTTIFHNVFVVDRQSEIPGPNRTRLLYVT